jgi:hypothetical protein
LRIFVLQKILDIAHYYVEFRSLSIQAPEMNTDEKLDHFINNLKPELSKQVHLKECKTIEAAYDAAVLYETFSQPTSNTTNSFMATRQHNHSNMNRNNNRNPRQYQQSNMDNNINNRINNNHSTMNSYNYNNNNENYEEYYESVYY